MKPQRLLIISSEKKPNSFWQQHLNIGDTALCNMDSSYDSFEAITTFQPHVIILDEYYTNQEDLYQLFLEKVNVFTTRANIFHVSPSNSWGHYQANFQMDKIKKHVFSDEFVAEVEGLLTNRRIESVS